MIRLNADDTPLEALADFYEPVELYDSTGTKLLGTFTPADMDAVTGFTRKRSHGWTSRSWLALQRNPGRAACTARSSRNCKDATRLTAQLRLLQQIRLSSPGAANAFHRSLCSRSGCSIGTCLVACF